MYNPKFSEDGKEFDGGTVIEFGNPCPHCEKPNFHSIQTWEPADQLVFTCLHCEKFFVIAYYARPLVEGKKPGLLYPFTFGVYKVNNDIIDCEKSYSVYPLENDMEV